MKTELQKVLNLRHFFKINRSHTNIPTYNLKRPAILLNNNIFINWLQSINLKTHKHMPVYTHMKFLDNTKEIPIGYITNNLVTYNEETVFKLDFEDEQKSNSLVELTLVVPQQDLLQYFIQWQRYRKYWWSSITTTPSLFTVNEKNDVDETCKADIVAKFPWGNHTVETISTTTNHNYSKLKCSLTLDNAMFTLLLDGLNNASQEYLRLHRNLAPFKFSFALQSEDAEYKIDLKALCELMYHRLKLKDVSAFIPDSNLTFQQQINENLQLGVTYTAILSENTLTNGIFHLLNSNTMLKEEIHVADLDSYAALICKNEYTK